MKKFRYFISIVAILTPLVLGVGYSLSRNFQPEAKINQSPLIMVSYFIPNSQLTNTGSLNKLKTDNLNLATATIATNWPDLKEAAVISDQSFVFIADDNLTIASNREDFTAQVDLNNKSVDNQSSVISVLEDESYQKYAQVAPGWHYKLYLTLDHNPDAEPQAIIINNQSYPLTRVGSFYLVVDYYSKEAVAIGLRPTDRGVTIKEAVAVTGQIPSRVYNPKRLSTKEVGSTVSISGSKLKITLLEANHYLWAEVLNDYQITKVGLGQQLGQISYNSHLATNRGFAQIELGQSHKLFFLKESGDYQISDLRRQNQTKRVGEVTIIAFLIIVFSIFYSQITDFIKKQTSLFSREVYQPIAVYAKNHLFDLIILTLSVNTLIVLRANPLVGHLLTPTNILVLFIFGLILVARLSLKVVVSLVVTLLLVSALLAQVQSTPLMDKVAACVYLLLILIIILLLATKTKKGRKR